MTIIKNRIERAFGLTEDLAKVLQDKDLTLHLGTLPSNSIGEQFWCIIGARESYFKAIDEEKWVGFSCSLTTTSSINEIDDRLNTTKNKLFEILNRDLSDAQWSLAMDLLEHEIQHHGQIIRYIYGNKLEFPISWNERYTV